MLDSCKVNQRYSRIQPLGCKDPMLRVFNYKRIEQSNIVLVEGLWAYEKLIKGSVEVETFAFCPEYIKTPAMLGIVDSIIAMAEKSYIISTKTCEKLSTQDSSEGFFMLCRLHEYKLEDIKLQKENLVVILDGVEQAGNIGTIIRSVDSAGGDAVILCDSKVRRNNLKLVKSSMGACFTLPVLQAELSEVIEWLIEKGFRIVVTDLAAEKNYFDTDYSGRVAIVAGNERHGISEIWRKQKCERVIIPMLGGSDSLNVGIATTLVAYEASMRQKGLIKRNYQEGII